MAVENRTQIKNVRSHDFISFEKEKKKFRATNRITQRLYNQFIFLYFLDVQTDENY